MDVGRRLEAGLTADYSLTLQAGSTIVATIRASNITVSAGYFQTQTLIYTSSSTPPAGNITIVLQSYGVQINFKNVRLNLSSPSTVKYYFSDMLGSANVITNGSGTIEAESDFYPFGGERVITDSGIGNTYKFTGKEHDGESGFDNFDARYYASALGRFVSSDWSALPVPVPYANLANPQTLNLYSYVHDNPESFADLDGHGMMSGGVEHDVHTNGHSSLTSSADPEGDSQSIVDQQARAQNAAERQQPAQQGTGQNASQGGFFQKLGNWLSGNGWKTNAQVVDEQRQWLIDNNVQRGDSSGNSAAVNWSKASAAEVAAAYKYVHEVLSAAAANHRMSLVGMAASVTFGHGARNLAGTGLSPGEVEAAIQRDIQASIKNAGESTGQFWGRVNVGGQTVEYRAYTLPSGTINVGTYYVP